MVCRHLVTKVAAVCSKKLDKLQRNLENQIEEWNTRFEQSEDNHKIQLSDSLKKLDMEWAARSDSQDKQWAARCDSQDR